MKKIFLDTLVLLSLMLLTGCVSNILPKASYSLYQVETVTAVGGDEQATISWINQDGKGLPLDYLLTWTAGSVAGQNGEMTVEASKNEVTISDLVNDCTYNFGVQARYEGGLSMKVEAKCTPKSTRIPVSEFKVMAGDGRAFVSWVAPETKLSYKYDLQIKGEGVSSKNVEIASSEKSYLAENLKNGVEYTFTITCVYGHGVSPSLSASATPGEIDPIVGPVSLYPFQFGKYEYNPAYFVSGNISSVEWNFGDNTTSNLDAPIHCFQAPGSYSVSITVKYESGNSETATINVTVNDFAWTSVAEVGYQKSSNIVFSHDGQSLYTVPQTLKKLIAIDAIMGTISWEYATEGATNGAGPVVGADGTIFFGTENSSGDNLFAVRPTGTLKWKKSMGGALKACPAVTSDGTIYVLAEGTKLYALNAETGDEKWSAELSGTGSGIVVDAEGNLYVATYNGLWSYTSTGSLRWTSSESLSMTERGGSLAIYDGLLYAALRGKAGCAAVSLDNGTVVWKYATTKGDCYHPVVDSEGTVYFSEKAGYIYAVTKDGKLKWKDTSSANYIYTGFVLDNKGNAYISQYASPFNLLKFDKSGTKTELITIGKQTMAPLSFGPDKRLYYVTNGTLSAYNLGEEIATLGWPTRGGNRQCTNSLK